jgi:hypothetical protein
MDELYIGAEYAWQKQRDRCSAEWSNISSSVVYAVMPEGVSTWIVVGAMPRGGWVE